MALMIQLFLILPAAWNTVTTSVVPSPNPNPVSKHEETLKTDTRAEG